MSDDQILKLAKLVEVQVVGILIQNNICEYIEKPKDNSNKKVINNFQNIRILHPYSDKVQNNDGFDITESDIEELRRLYPRGSDRRGSVGVIFKKLKRFLTEHPEYSYMDIRNSIASYVQHQLSIGNKEMLFNLDNIFYKREGSIEKQPMLGILEKYSTVNSLQDSVNSQLSGDE